MAAERVSRDAAIARAAIADRHRHGRIMGQHGGEDEGEAGLHPEDQWSAYVAGPAPFVICDGSVRFPYSIASDRDGGYLSTPVKSARYNVTRVGNDQVPVKTRAIAARSIAARGIAMGGIALYASRDPLTVASRIDSRYMKKAGPNRPAFLCYIDRGSSRSHSFLSGGHHFFLV